MKTPSLLGKVRGLHILFFIFGSLLILFCIRWQLIKGAELKEVANSRIYTSELDSLRGSIYAKDGTTLAYSEPRYDMFIWYGGLEYAESRGDQTRTELISKVAPLIEKTPEELEKTITDSYNKGLLWIPIAESITVDTWKKINDLSSTKTGKPLEGFQFEYTSYRIYPEGRLASHLIGLTTKYKDRFEGVGGIEEAWDGNLNPRKGLVIKESDGKGDAVASSLIPTIEPKKGKSIYTTIDKKLQMIVEAQLKDAIGRYQAESGSIIIMDPKTGEIMAMASSPDYDPNVREEKDPEVYGNIAISSPYEMGSIGKVMTMSAAIDLGLINPDTVIMPEGHEGCEHFTDELGDLCTWNKAPQPGPLTAEKCLVLSDNICFYHISKLMQDQDFYKYLDRFGIGKPTGIDISGESYGPLKDYSEWNVGDTAAFSYGHGYLVNALQSISGVASIANYGVRMQPHVTYKVVDEETGEENIQEPRILETVLDKQTAETMANSMYKVYQDNIRDFEPWYHDLRNYRIGMKSGSALIADSTGYTDALNNSYVGFDMSPDRKFIMLVKLEKPAGGLSFYNARTMWLDAFIAVKDHLGVPRI